MNTIIICSVIVMVILFLWIIHYMLRNIREYKKILSRIDGNNKNKPPNKVNNNGAMKEQVTQSIIKELLEKQKEYKVSSHSHALLTHLISMMPQWVDSALSKLTAPTDEELRKIKVFEFHKYYLEGDHIFNESVLTILEGMITNPQTK